jgi:hypothetical protein
MDDIFQHILGGQFEDAYETIKTERLIMSKVPGRNRRKAQVYVFNPFRV